MKKRVTVSLPEDVAARLEREDNMSAYVTEVIRAKMRAEQTERALTAAGYPELTAEQMEAYGRLFELERRYHEESDPQVRQSLLQQHRELRSRLG